MNQFWIFTQEHIEKLYDDIIQAQNIIIMSYLGYEKITKEFENVVKELETIVKTGVEFNKNHKKKLNKE